MRYLICVILSLLAFSGCVSTPKPTPVDIAESRSFNPHSIDKVAVVAFHQKRQSRRLLEDEFIKTLIYGGYTVASRSDLKEVQKEISFQRSDLTESEAVKVGKFLNVDAVVAIEILKFKKYSKYGDYELELMVKVIDVETSEILWMASANKKGHPFNVATKLARTIGNKIPRKVYQNEPLTSSTVWDDSKVTFDKIAVISSGRRLKQNLKKNIEGSASKKLMQRGYKVPARSLASSILKEINFQRSGLTADGAAKLGRILNVPALMVISVNKDVGMRINKERKYCIGLGFRLIDIEKNEIVYCSSYYLSFYQKKYKNDYFQDIVNGVLNDFPQAKF